MRQKIDVNRRKRLEYNARYDDKKRKARELGLLPKYPKSIVLQRPRDMSQSKFDSLVRRYKLI